MHDTDTTRLEAGESYEEETYETTFHEAEEEALAAELLGVSSESEMNQFLGNLFKGAAKMLGGPAGKFLKKNAGTLAGALKGVAKTALPFAGGALGSFVPIPGVGTAIGTALGGAAANLLEAQTESEAYEGEDHETAKAKNFVRFAGNTIRHGAKTSGRSQQPKTAVLNAMRAALARLRRQVIQQAGGQLTQNNNSQDWSAAPADDGGGFVDAGADAAQDAGGFSDGGDFSGETYEGETYEGETYENEWAGEAPARQSSGARSGRWIRRGGKIVLLGL